MDNSLSRVLTHLRRSTATAFASLISMVDPKPSSRALQNSFPLGGYDSPRQADASMIS